MNGGVIQYILGNNPYTAKFFKGFCTYDLPLPKNFSKPAIFILNTDRWYGDGEHWCVVNFVSDNVCEFFDSYGKPPCYYNFDKILYPHVKNIVYNKFRVQGLKPTCGHHCLFFILFRYYGYSSSFILKKVFRHKTLADLERNDSIVYDYIKNNFGAHYATFIDY
jgi:hypothetical protein